MRLGFHGGKCCGIKTIFGFSSPDPQYVLDEYTGIDGVLDKELTYADTCMDVDGDHVSSKKRYFHGRAPEETQLRRLDRYLRYCDLRSPGVLIEIALADFKRLPSYIEGWRSHLEERGFRVVSEFNNSNTDNKIAVFHRVGEGAKEDRPYWAEFCSLWAEEEKKFDAIAVGGKIEEEIPV